MNEKIMRRNFIKQIGYTGLAASVIPGSTIQAAQESEKPITLAFVGCAHIHTPGFVKLLRDRKDVRVKYVWDHDEARATKRAGELASQAIKDIGVVWSDREVAGVVICSETNRHPELVFAAAKAGKHMFVEKPLAITAKESYAMANAIEKAGLLFTTGYFNRTNPRHLFLKEQIASGNFGKITHISGLNCHGGSLGGWFDTEWRWMADPKIAGVGGFGDLGTHLLDILMWMIGDIETVAADIKVITGRYGDCDETGEALIKFKTGVTGSLTAGWVDVANPVTLMISGTEAHAAVINGELYYRCRKVEGADGKTPYKQLPPAPAAPLHLFVDSVAGKKGLPLVTPREAADRVAAMEAMYLAAREQRWVAPVKA